MERLIYRFLVQRRLFGSFKQALVNVPVISTERRSQTLVGDVKTINDANRVDFEPLQSSLESGLKRFNLGRLNVDELQRNQIGKL